tara:strand:+ start:876 stop:1958 length:1083 start_codon:yes stop_codon:yes gene_type:complete
MFINLNPEEKTVSTFEVYKRHEYQNTNNLDTATDVGIFSLEAVSASFYNFKSESADNNSVTMDSIDYKYYKAPLFAQIDNNFFKYAHAPNNKSNDAVQPQFVLDKFWKPWGHTSASSAGTPHWELLALRRIHNRANVISLPQALYGEGVKSGSIVLTSYESSGNKVFKDDGFGNLYDQAYEDGFNNGILTGSYMSGSSVGIVNYSQGLVIITDTGSYQYSGLDSGSATGALGWKVQFDSTKTINQYEYYCSVGENKANWTQNLSISKDRKGTEHVPEIVNTWNSGSLRRILRSPAESLYGTSTIPTNDVENFATHSDFAPYVTTIGLYNDNNDLLAVSKLSRAIRKDPELSYTFVVRFDI